ncbi:TetR/AcrR family transcriptional regulator [uncultured Jatrophihabitans sp.]|uniref:TetR/AcrR family transcriptional regulator n=1 Tax=uncultured Jatrophihabitans sp. TaxID=1610747 RepID=UPI0035CA4310
MPSEGPDPSRRNERSRRAILDEVVNLIGEVGYARASVEELARRAGVGKQTVYRWWPSMGAVVLEAITERSASVVPFADTGDLVADLRTQMMSVIDLFTTRFGAVYRALIAAAQSDNALSQAHLDQYIFPATVDCRQRFETAIERGEIRGDIDIQATIDLLYGAIYYRLVLQTRPLDPAQIDAALDIVVRGLK